MASTGMVGQKRKIFNPYGYDPSCDGGTCPLGSRHLCQDCRCMETWEDGPKVELRCYSLADVALGIGYEISPTFEQAMNCSCDSVCPGLNGCSGHGDCEGSVCLCQEGFTGPKCDLSDSEEEEGEEEEEDEDDEEEEEEAPTWLTDIQKSCRWNKCYGNADCEWPDIATNETEDTLHLIYKESKASGWVDAVCGKCAKGSGGPNCENVCPSTSLGRVCNWPYGKCNDKGVCECKNPAKIKGEACEFECPTGSDGLICSGAPCNEYGICQCPEGMGGKACDVEACPKDQSGVFCGQNGVCAAQDGECVCDKGYFGELCDDTCETASGEVCSGHGTCDADLTCECDDGYGGPKCDKKCPGEDEVCSGHGKCDYDAMCQCGSGWEGPKCDEEMCTTEELSSNGKACSGHGDCTGQYCVCDLGYFGDDCSSSCEFGPNNKPCSGIGNCLANGKCECPHGYAGSDCSKSCPRGVTGKVCSGHGVCEDDGTCTCDPLFDDGDCGKELTVDDAGACPVISTVHSSGEKCSGHGSCVASSTGFKCSCFDGYVGPDCIDCPNFQGKTCSNNGRCKFDPSFEKAVCECKDGFSGTKCETMDMDCPSNCNSHGDCYISEVGISACACHNG